MLAQITWSTSAASTGGDWNYGPNWVGGVAPGPGDTAVIEGLTSPGTVYMQSGAADSIHSLTTDSTTTLEIITGSLTLGAGSSSTFGGQVTVVSNASLIFGAGATLQLAAGSTLTDNGTTTFASGDTVALDGGVGGCCSSAPSPIVVGGTLKATDTAFNGGSGTITASSGGDVIASGSVFNISSLDLTNTSVLNSNDLMSDTFNMPIYVPYADVPYLGNNTSFTQIEINNGTISSGTLNLNVIGTNSSMSYVFYQSFMVGAQATVAVGLNVAVDLPSGSTLTDNGTMTFASGDTVALEGGVGGCCSSAPSPIVVEGTLSATDTTFNGGSGTITASSGGDVIASGSVFNISSLDLTNTSVLNSNDLTSDTFNMPIYVPYADVAYLKNNASFTQIEINSGTISSGTLNLNVIGTNSSMSYVFYQSFMVGAQATVAVGPNVAVDLPSGSTLTDNGTMTFASGDTVALEGGVGGCCSSAPSPIVVGGTLSATDTTFNGGSSTITADSGGDVIASSSVFNISSLDLTSTSVLNSKDLTNDTFNMPIYVPYADVAYLGNNASFTQIEINNGTISSGTLNLNVIGTNSSMSYVFYQSFMVGAQATVAVGPNVAVVLPVGSTLTDNGTMTFATGDTVALEGGVGGCCSSAPSPIVVGGTLSATDTTFNGGSGTITADSGGVLDANSSTFSLASITLDSGSSATLSTNVFYNVLAINSNTTINISGNDFSHLTNPDGLVASGDPNATINVPGNYWGTTDPVQIGNIIEDHNDNASLPTVNFQPYVSGVSGTSANPASKTFSPSDQTVNLSATVTTSAGLAINEGTETFSIWNGTQQVGQTTAPQPVSNGNVSATFTLPGNTPVGQYIIEADYSGSSQYLPSIDTSHFLTVNPAAASKLVIILKPLATATAGVAFATQPIVAEEDQYGHIITSDSAHTVTVARGGAGTASLQGSNLTVTLASGIATFSGLSYDKSETMDLAFTTDASGVSSVTSDTIAVSPATASKVVFGQQPTNVSAGAAIGPAVTLEVEDAFNNVVTADGSTVTLTLSSGTFEGGSNIASATASKGVATFSGLKIVSLGSYTLSATDGLLSPPSASNSFTVGPAAARLVFQIPPYTSVTAGNPLTDPIVIDEEDQNGNLVTSDNTTMVTVSLASGPGTLLGPTTVKMSGGIASFDYLEDDTAGSLTLRFSAGNLPPVTSTPTLVSPAPASKLKILTRPPGGIVTGKAFSLQVDALDPYNNLATSFAGPVTVGLASGAGALSGTLTVPANGGVATFNDLVENTSGSISLTAASGNLTPSTAIGIMVTPAPSQAVLETVVFNQKINKKTHKPSGPKTLAGYTITFDSAMDQTALGNGANYEVDNEVIKTEKVKVGKKTVTKKVPTFPSIGFRVSQVTSDSVTLTLSGKPTFPKGGQLTVKAAGLDNIYGVFMTANQVFTISKGGKQIS